MEFIIELRKAEFTLNELGESRDRCPAVTETPTRGPLSPLGKEPMASALSSKRERRNAKSQYAKISDTAGRLSDGITRVPVQRIKQITGYEKHVNCDDIV